MIPFSAYFPNGSVADLQKHYLNFIPSSQWYLAVLECEHQDYPGHLLGRVCYTQRSSDAIEFPYCGFVEIDFPMTPFDPSRPFEIVLPTALFDPKRRFDVLPLSPASLERFPALQVEVKTVYIPHTSEEHDGVFEVTRWTPHDSIKMVVLKKTSQELQAKGYAVELREPDPSHPNIHSLTLTHATHTIAVEFQHTLTGGPSDQKLIVRNRVTVSGHVRGSAVMHASLPWGRTLGFGGSHIVVDLPGTGEFLLSNELTLATKDHYAIHVELRPKASAREAETVENRRVLFEQRDLEIGAGEVRVVGGGEGSGNINIARALEARSQWRRMYGPGGQLDEVTPWRYGKGEPGGASAVPEA